MELQVSNRPKERCSGYSWKGEGRGDQSPTFLASLDFLILTPEPSLVSNICIQDFDSLTAVQFRNIVACMNSQLQPCSIFHCFQAARKHASCHCSVHTAPLPAIRPHTLPSAISLKPVFPQDSEKLLHEASLTTLVFADCPMSCSTGIWCFF